MTFLTSLGDSIRNGFCTLANTAQDFGIGVDVSAEYRGVDVGVDLIRLAQRLTCNREPSAGYDPPFSGGQCPINYTVNVSWNRVAQIGFTCQNVNESSTQLAVLGPILGLEVVSIAPSSKRLQIIHGVGGAARRDVFTYANGTVCNAQFNSFQITSVTPPAGVPDNCGSLPPDVPPSEPGDRTTDNSFTYMDSSSNVINVDSSVTFGDISIDLSGELSIPFQVTYDDVLPFTFNGNLNLTTGDVDLSPGNPNYNPSGEPNPDAYATDEDIPDVPPDVPIEVIPPNANEPDDNTTKVIRGVIVTVTSIDSDATTIFQTDNPDIYVPNLGFVQFQVSIQNAIAWTTDIAVKNKRHFIECPWSGGALNVSGTPRGGVTWTLSPVWALVEKTEDFD